MGVWDLVCTELGGGLGSIFMTILNRQHPKNGGMLGVFIGVPRNLGWGLGKGPSIYLSQQPIYTFTKQL